METHVGWGRTRHRLKVHDFQTICFSLQGVLYLLFLQNSVWGGKPFRERQLLRCLTGVDAEVWKYHPWACECAAQRWSAWHRAETVVFGAGVTLAVAFGIRRVWLLCKLLALLSSPPWRGEDCTFLCISGPQRHQICICNSSMCSLGSPSPPWIMVKNQIICSLLEKWERAGERAAAHTDLNVIAQYSYLGGTCVLYGELIKKERNAGENGPKVTATSSSYTSHAAASY